MSRRLVADLALLALAIGVALALRAWAVGIAWVPSGSMLPALLSGDVVLVEKWPVRWQRRMPARGDIVLIQPVEGERLILKRVIGLPGDMIGLRHGGVRLNGHTLPRWRVADLLLPGPCPGDAGTSAREERRAGQKVCRVRRFREMLPGGHTVDALDRGDSEGDDRPAARVPPGRLFVLGDDRDRSADSRFGPPKGTGFVPVAGLVGRVRIVLLSIDGGAGWRHALRWRRIALRL